MKNASGVCKGLSMGPGTQQVLNEVAAIIKPHLPSFWLRGLVLQGSEGPGKRHRSSSTARKKVVGGWGGAW